MWTFYVWWLADCRLVLRTGAPVHSVQNVSWTNCASRARRCASTRLTRLPQAGPVTGTGTHLSALMGRLRPLGVEQFPQTPITRWMLLSPYPVHKRMECRLEEDVIHRLSQNWRRCLGCGDEGCYCVLLFWNVWCWCSTHHTGVSLFATEFSSECGKQCRQASVELAHRPTTATAELPASSACCGYATGLAES